MQCFDSQCDTSPISVEPFQFHKLSSPSRCSAERLHFHTSDVLAALLSLRVLLSHGYTASHLTCILMHTCSSTSAPTCICLMLPALAHFASNQRRHRSTMGKLFAEVDAETAEIGHRTEHALTHIHACVRGPTHTHVTALYTHSLGRGTCRCRTYLFDVRSLTERFSLPPTFSAPLFLQRGTQMLCLRTPTCCPRRASSRSALR